MSILTNIAPDDVNTYTTYATPKSIYTETLTPHTAPIERICGNCKHWQEGYCQNPNMPAFIEGGIKEPVAYNFGCLPLWEAKESEVAEGE